VILVTGTIDVDPAQRDAFIEAATKLMGPTRAEAGCERYAFTADVEDPGRFHVVEQWASEDEMNAHMQAPHLAEFMATIGAFVRGAGLTKWEGATGSKLM
jgi:quinol monooxygenase YgiN